MAAKAASAAFKLASKAPFEAALSTLRHHYKEDDNVINILATGLNVDNAEVNKIANEMLRILEATTSGNS